MVQFNYMTIKQNLSSCFHLSSKLLSYYIKPKIIIRLHNSLPVPIDISVNQQILNDKNYFLFLFQAYFN